MCIYIYTHIATLLCCTLKLTQHCKSTIPQLKKQIHSLNAETANLWGKSDEFALNFLSESFFFLKSCFSNGTNQRGSVTHRAQAFRSLNHTLYFCAISLCAKMPIIREPQDSLLTVHPESMACWFPWVCEPLWGWCNATQSWCSGNICWLNAPLKLVSQDKKALFPHHVETQQKLNGSFF